MNDNLAGMVALLVPYVTAIAVFVNPQIFNRMMLIMHQEHRRWWVAPKDAKSYTARPVLIRIYMSPFIILITWVLYRVLTGEDL